MIKRFCILAFFLMAAPCLFAQGVSRPVVRYDLFTIAGNFPPGLNTAAPASLLGIDETPDGYGFDLEKDGRLAKSVAVPSGTVRIQRIVTLNSTNYFWHYQRLWGLNGTTLEYYAPLYDDVLVRQRSSRLPFNEDTNNILTIVPFRPDNLCVAKQSGSYILSNLSDTRALFQRSDIIQELRITNALHMTELDGTVYASNDKGLTGYKGDQSVEITRKVRNDSSIFREVPLIVDYEKHRIIGTNTTVGSGFVYDPEQDKIFKYNNQFRFTSRQFHTPDWRSFYVDRVLFVIEHGNTANGFLKYQVKYEDDDWERERRVDLRYQAGEYTLVSESMATPMNAHKFQIRLTDLSTGKYIWEIRLDSTAFNVDDYSR